MSQCPENKWEASRRMVRALGCMPHRWWDSACA